MSIKFVRSHETYNDIQFFLYDYVKENNITYDDIIVSMRYDENDKIENELFLYENYCGFGAFEARNDFLEDQEVIEVIGFRTVSDPSRFHAIDSTTCQGLTQFTGITFSQFNKLKEQEISFLNSLDILSILDINSSVGNNMEKIQVLKMGEYQKYIESISGIEDCGIFTAISQKDFANYLCDRYGFKYMVDSVYFVLEGNDYVNE